MLVLIHWRLLPKPSYVPSCSSVALLPAGQRRRHLSPSSPSAKNGRAVCYKHPPPLLQLSAGSATMSGLLSTMAPLLQTAMSSATSTRPLCYNRPLPLLQLRLALLQSLADSCYKLGPTLLQAATSSATMASSAAASHPPPSLTDVIRRPELLCMSEGERALDIAGGAECFKTASTSPVGRGASRRPRRHRRCAKPEL